MDWQARCDECMQNIECDKTNDHCESCFSHDTMVWLIIITLLAWATSALSSPLDYCAAIAGKAWVSPLQARSCMHSFPVEPELKHNIIQVVNRTIALHASVNYQISAPEPFRNDVHEDLHKDLARILDQEYASEFQFHQDLFHTFRRLNDGHCVVINRCYDSLYISYLPTPLVLLTEADGKQNIHIAPEAFAVASAEFGDEIKFWQDALPTKLQGQLESLNGALVLAINDQDPFVAVNANTLVTGGYQSFGTRQNSFFSSYYRGQSGWLYQMGNFAQQVHPLTDAVQLTIKRVNSSSIDIITLPYRSRFGSASKNFTDSASYRANNCLATNETNGLDMYAQTSLALQQAAEKPLPIATFQQQPPVPRKEARKHAMNVLVDALPLTNIALPEVLHPLTPALNESYSVAQFYMLKDNTTGILALGSFSAANFTALQLSLLDGLEKVRSLGATQLLVDVTNNGGGYVCIAHWLHRIIIGSKSTTDPQAGLDTTIRAGPLAQLIVQRIIKDHMDPDTLLSYNPTQWTNASNIPFTPESDWLKPLRNLTINGQEDVFSQRLGQECQPFDVELPKKGLFEAKNVVIISNGRCASSCSLFSITMSKLEGVRTVVLGGKQSTQQQYCGVVGGQSTDFATMDTEIKTTHLKNHSLAPPDLLANMVQGITWRLGYGIDDPLEPEEWQDHPADINFPLTMETVNRPIAIWESVSKMVFNNFAAPPFVIQEP
ncbi:hypothetical protein D9757_000663 [Collybiopsis confluens]|uniref:Tail specific protease domain-containing protein n=1 Tax=Collybiopsis confluens TaxID=2823264 RepID=A0A8H5I1H9_9AGAR|nr:hypothetical protein D9757_000663 [Collybiopsis confluens]